MSLSTIGTGVALSAVGVGAWVASNRASATALIPAFIGTPMMVLGVVESLPGIGTVPRVTTAVLAIAAVGGASRGLPGLAKLLRGESVERPIAVVAQSVTVGLAGGYLMGRLFLR